MRARDGYRFLLLLGIYAAIEAKPTTLVAQITTPSNQSIEQWQHVNKTCQTQSGDCDEAMNMKHLHQLTRHMRLDVQPCDNFYQYACGNWAKDEKYGNSVNMMRYGDEQLVEQYVQLFTQAQLHTRYRRKQQTANNDAVFDKMLLYYSVCQRAQQSRSAISLSGYAEALHALGVWNASDSWLDTLARLGRYGYADHYVQLHVKQKNVSQHEVHILPHNKDTHAKLDQEIFQIIKIYTHHSFDSLQQAFKLLEADLEAIVKTYVQDCSSAELDEDNECDLFRYYSYDQLRKAAPSINWQRFIGLHLNNVPTAELLFGVDALNSIERLVHYVNNMNPELRRIYTVVRFLNYVQLHMSKLRQPLSDNYNNRCVRHMRKTLYLPMLYVYESAYYAPRRADNDRVISEIFEQLKAEFSYTLQRNEMQLSNISLKFLRDKLMTLRLNMGNLPQHVNQQFYKDYVHTLNVSGNFYYNHLNALQHFYAQLKRLAQGGRALYPEWYSFNQHSPEMPDNVDSTAYYFVLSNMIVMPYAYLQAPFYDARFWPALLYGDLANTLGHEMMHAFDNNFLIYDHAGNMAEEYKQIFANAEFRRRLSALETGTMFLSERIADISGSHLALRTFLKDSRFRYANGKLYFLQFAQFFCGSEQNVADLMLNDPTHDINSQRLNYAVSHLTEFTQIFQCAKGSAMNIAERYVMW